jgi:hypothetical protein
MRLGDTIHWGHHLPAVVRFWEKCRRIQGKQSNRKEIDLLSTKKKVIAVIGATGHQGGAVLRALQAGGQFQVRALTRNPVLIQTSPKGSFRDSLPWGRRDRGDVELLPSTHLFGFGFARPN